MTEDDVIAGTIEKLVPWKTGKGYFLTMTGSDEDFYGFGTCKAEAGDVVSTHFKEGTGSFSDKLQITKVVKDSSPEGVKSRTIREADEMENLGVKTGDKIYMTRDDAIIQQCCLKVAGRIISELYPKVKDRAGLADIADSTLYLKDRFFHDLLGMEETEEPEEK